MAKKIDPPPPRTQPPPPTISPPTTSYRSARKEELEQLRQKGLAKIFNKHFTSVADKIRQEREAAELALQEIVKRKAELAANPKSFKEGGLTLTQLDKLHMELKKRKSEVQRKERETQELYKRYCSQFSDNEHVLADVATWKNSTSALALNENAGAKGNNANGEGYADIIRQADLAINKAAELGDATNNANVNGITADLENKSPKGSDGENVDMVAKQVWTPSPTGMPEHSFTSPGVSPLQAANVATTPIVPDVRAPSAAISPNKVTMCDYKKENLNTTALSTPTPNTPPADSPSVLGNASVMDRSLYFLHNNHDDDDSSAVSGLTDIDGATVAEAEWKLTEFLRTETENIKRMLSNEPLQEEDDEDNDHDTYSVFTYNRSLVSGESDRVGKAAREAEAMVTRMAAETAWINDPTLLDSESDEENGDDDNDYEWVAFWSGDHEKEYYHNVVTNQTCWTRPQNVEIDFSKVKGMKLSAPIPDAKAKDNVMSSPTKSVTSTNYANLIHSPTSAEKVAVRDFTKNSSSNATPSADAISVSRYTNGHMISSFRPEGTGSTNGSISMSQSESPSVATNGSSTKNSKVMQYRRKRAKIAKRNRRIGFAIFLTVVFGIVFFMKKDEWLSQEVDKTVEIDANASIAKEEEDKAKALRKLELAKKLAAAEAERKRILEQKKLEAEALKEQKRLEAERLKEQNRLEAERLKEQKRFEAEQKKLEAERIKKQKEEEARRLAEEKKKADAAALKLKKQKEEEEQRRKEIEAAERKAELERKKKIDEELQRLKDEEDQKERQLSLQLHLEELRRPWACNIPLTYLMSRKCWKVAKVNPVYDCKALTDSMME